jgi:hypothetical protein
VYGIQGDIVLGDTGGSSIDFKDQDAVVVFEDRVEGASTNTPFKFSGDHSATGTFSLELGVAVSTGDDESGSNGVIFKNANPVAQPITFDFSDADIEDVFIYGGSLTGLRTGTIAFGADATNSISHHLSGVQFSDCIQVDTGKTVVRNSAFIGYSGSAGALFWDADTNVKNCQFLGNSRGIEMTLVTNQIYDNLSFAGNTFDTHLNNGGTDIDVAKNNGSNPTSQTNTGGGTITYTSAAVTALVHVEDPDAVDLQNARVYLHALDGTGPLPFQDSVTISRSTTTATVTHTAHGMITGDKVVIKGITDKTEDNNGVKTITVTGVNTYTYVTTDAGSTSYTGAIVSTWVAIEELTDVTGDADIVRSFSADQPVEGRVVMSTNSPRYKPFDIAGTISQTDGLTINVQMILDE